MLASNNVYRLYGGRDETGPSYLSQYEDLVRSLIVEKGDGILEDKRYLNAVNSVIGDVHRLVYRIFNGRVYQQARRLNLTGAILDSYRDQPCFVYGGGIGLPIPQTMYRIRIHDQGRLDLKDDDKGITCLRRDPVNKYILSPDRILKPRESLTPEEASLLVVAYGLSFPQVDSKYLWDDDLYVRDYEDGRDSSFYRDGLYIYDVVERGWRGRPKYIHPGWFDAPQPVSIKDELAIIPLPLKKKIEKQHLFEENHLIDGNRFVTCPSCSNKRQVKWIIGHLWHNHGRPDLDQYLLSNDVFLAQNRIDGLVIRYCPTCDTLQLNYDGLVRHKKNQHPRVKCPICKKWFDKFDDRDTCPECREKMEIELKAHAQWRKRHRSNGRNTKGGKGKGKK